AAAGHRGDRAPPLRREICGAADAAFPADGRNAPDARGVSLEAPRRLAPPARRSGGRRGGGGTRLGGGIHHRALLGVFAPSRWRHSRVSGRASALASVAGRGGEPGVRRRRSLRNPLRAGAGSETELGLSGRRLAGDRLPGREDPSFLPQLDPRLIRSRGKSRAVRRNRQRGEEARGGRERVAELLLEKVPEAHGGVEAGAGEEEIAGEEDDGRDRFSMAVQGGREVAGGGVPELDRAVDAAGRDETAVL